jgi:hypothetical protein
MAKRNSGSCAKSALLAIEPDRSEGCWTALIAVGLHTARAPPALAFEIKNHGRGGELQRSAHTDARSESWREQSGHARIALAGSPAALRARQTLI